MEGSQECLRPLEASPASPASSSSFSSGTISNESVRTESRLAPVAESWPPELCRMGGVCGGRGGFRRFGVSELNGLALRWGARGGGVTPSGLLGVGGIDKAGGGGTAGANLWVVTCGENESVR